MATLLPLNLMKWIDDHAEVLKPPVGNAQIWQDGEFLVTVVGGPNVRTDYHDDPGDEFFYQLRGNMNLRVIEGGKVRDMPICEGEILLLPAHTRHSPQRPADTVGMVIERLRQPGELDAFEWYCEKCEAKVHRREVEVTDLVRDLLPVFDEYYGDTTLRTCPSCGHENPGEPSKPGT